MSKIPSSPVSLGQDGILRVQGTPGRDTLSVMREADAYKGGRPDVLVIQGEGPQGDWSQRVSTHRVKGLELKAGAGNDEYWVDQGVAKTNIPVQIQDLEGNNNVSRAPETARGQVSTSQQAFFRFAPTVDAVLNQDSGSAGKPAGLRERALNTINGFLDRLLGNKP